MEINYDVILKELVKEYKIKAFMAPFLLCFIGGPGYGKSFISKLISKREDIPIVSNDRTRRFLDNIEIDSKNQDIVHRLAYLQIEYLLKHNSSVILDANAIRQHEIISKKVDLLNVKCFYVNLTCNEDSIIERLKYRESMFGKDDNCSRATIKNYLDYQEELKKLKFPQEKIFFEIRTDKDLDIQINNLFNKIESS